MRSDFMDSLALPAARCPLPAARCPLPAARCPLPAARCPLPAARCHVLRRPEWCNAAFLFCYSFSLSVSFNKYCTVTSVRLLAATELGLIFIQNIDLHNS
ncbi:hypothetical protein R84981_001183 [Carnimonas sp. R-84981]|uniref:hypothetical protein n=1 Tax=Carnimonas bestiolae TaxID=3402172 RepID=UPI003EDBF0F3